ncbi:glycosyl hydrolase [Streptobacillus moniliformis]|uniref:exo-alpha-sialidase n=3 Tax=Streptobacillus moniliformis TaxID=34105 RepID=D1AW29_STRM9|nr:glycosyl hydrolase BNR repeat-containing protein [Streptobacillus moniliformis DSM 12112]AVL43077.1 glycosyl hydrolase [Streptobacillus moniliformis]SQA12852.1 Sialidase [Streptobacillus moniliformis]
MVNMNRKILMFFILSTQLLNALGSYNNGFFDGFKEENLTKVKYDNSTYPTEGQIGKPENNGKWPGIGPNGEKEGTATLLYTRIPSIIVTNDNKIIVMYDLRWNNPKDPGNNTREKIGADHGRIDQGISISEDGGKTWKTKTGIKFDDIWRYGKRTAPQKYRRRLMDSTLIYNHLTDEILSLHGSWNEFTGGNWYAKREDYYNKEIWAALMHKSIDGGKTWERTHKFDKNNNGLFKEHSPDNPVKAFLGGVGTGIVMRDGTLVMSVQTAHENKGMGKKAIGATLMYSRDGGKTWQMPKIDNSKILMPNSSSLENMLFEMDGKLVITGRGIDTSNNSGQRNNKQRNNMNNKHRWAYYTEDMGQTWKKFEPLHTFQTVTSQATQGSTLYVTLPSGKKVILVSAPKGNGNDSWKRGNLALYALSGKDKNHMKEITLIKPGSGNALGAGYSSLAYKGGNLFAAYEDNGDISVKNLTEYIAEIEKLATEWGLEDERAKDIKKVKELKSLTTKQKELLEKAMMEDNDRAFTEAMVLNTELEELDKNVAKYSKELEDNKEALPSSIRRFNSAIEGLKGEKRDNLVKVLKTRIIKAEVDDTGENIKDVMDFDLYKPVAEKFLYKRVDIAENDDNIFAGFGVKVGSTDNYFKFGYNHDISNFKLGGFFEIYESKINARNISVGTTFKTVFENKHTFKNFIRYRHQSLYNLKINNKNDRYNDVILHNLDFYSSYETKLNLNKNISITPKAGILLTYSHEALLDEDARLDRRIGVSTDISVKAELKHKNTKFKIKPEILITDNAKYISQTNLSNKRDKTDNKILEYNIQFGISAKVNGINLDLDLDLNDTSKNRNKTNVRLNFMSGYSW